MPISDLLAAAEGDLDDLLEVFIAATLHDAGVWHSPRASDGISAYRLLERTPSRILVCGKIWTIDQVLHTFCLEVARDTSVAWTLYYEPDATSLSPGRAHQVFDALQAPSDVPWVHTLGGIDRTA